MVDVCVVGSDINSFPVVKCISSVGRLEVLLAKCKTVSGVGISDELGELVNDSVVEGLGLKASVVDECLSSFGFVDVRFDVSGSFVLADSKMACDVGTSVDFVEVISTFVDEKACDVVDASSDFKGSAKTVNCKMMNTGTTKN